MLELTVAATSGGKEPAVLFKKLQYVGYFHLVRLPPICPLLLELLPLNELGERAGREI